MKLYFSDKKMLALLLISLSILPACSQSEEQQVKEVSTETRPKPPPKTVAWLSLTESSAGNRLLSGQVSAAETTILSFESSGKVKSVDVNLGDRFAKGQRLATLDTTNYNLQLRKAKAALGTARANRNQALKEINRFKELVNAKAAPQIQLDGYQLQYQTAQESINNAQAQIELAQKQLKDTVLIAPFSGVVTERLAEVGQLANPSIPIYRAEVGAPLEVSFGVPEHLISSIKLGQHMQVNIPPQPSVGKLSATVSKIATKANFGAFTVKMRLKNAPKVIKPGMTAEVALPVAKRVDGFSIPPSALGAGSNNSHFVYRIIADHSKTQADTRWTLEQVPVSISTLSGESVVVQGNLASGDKLVRSGWSFLTPNQSVRLMGVGAVTVNP